MGHSPFRELIPTRRQRGGGLRGGGGAGGSDAGAKPSCSLHSLRRPGGGGNRACAAAAAAPAGGPDQEMQVVYLRSHPGNAGMELRLKREEISLCYQVGQYCGQNLLNSAGELWETT